MKAKEILLLFIVFIILAFCSLACHSKSRNPVREQDPVKEKMMEIYSADYVKDRESGIWIDDRKGTVNSGEIAELFQFSRWEQTEESTGGEPILTLFPLGFSDETKDFWVKIYDDLAYVNYETKIPVASFPSVWYSLPDECSGMIRTWAEAVKIIPYEDAPGTPVYDFFGLGSPVYKMKEENPVEVLVHYEDDPQSKDAVTTDTYKWIDGIMEAFSYLRVLEETAQPDGRPFSVTFRMRDAEKIQLRFKGECLFYQNHYYSLFTNAGFFECVQDLAKAAD